MSKATAPNKKELARFKVMSDLGLTPNAIAKRTGRDPKTIRKYLLSEAYTDPDVGAMIDAIKEGEIADLCLLVVKARSRLHEHLDRGKTRVIETVAIMDRAFQQRRLLEGQSTGNLSILHADLKALDKILDAEKEE